MNRIRQNNILRSNVEENEFIHINRLALFGFRGFLYAKQSCDRCYAQLLCFDSRALATIGLCLAFIFFILLLFCQAKVSLGGLVCAEISSSTHLNPFSKCSFVYCHFYFEDIYEEFLTF